MGRCPKDEGTDKNLVCYKRSSSFREKLEKPVGGGGGGGGGGQSDASLGLGMSNMSFLTEDLMQFVFCTMATFSQGDGTKINSMQFSEFRSQTHTITHGFYLTSVCLSFS